jgi:hypothetical protein
MFHKLHRPKDTLSLTPCCRGPNRFSSFSRRVETAKSGTGFASLQDTSLKRGVNETPGV